jgi:DNA-binding MarR family transcriptional regulator
VEQFHILRHVSKGLGSISELADAKQISRPAISQAVDVLVNKGLLSRTQEIEDRRYVKLELTEDGSALLSAVFTRSRKWMADKWIALPESDLQIMSQAFQILQCTFTE